MKINEISTYLIVFILFILSMFYIIDYSRTKDVIYREEQPFYLTIDKDGYAWLGDYPGHKQVPFYDEKGRQRRVEQ